MQLFILQYVLWWSQYDNFSKYALHLLFVIRLNIHTGTSILEVSKYVDPLTLRMLIQEYNLYAEAIEIIGPICQDPRQWANFQSCWKYVHPIEIRYKLHCFHLCPWLVCLLYNFVWSIYPSIKDACNFQSNNCESYKHNTCACTLAKRIDFKTNRSLI